MSRFDYIRKRCRNLGLSAKHARFLKYYFEFEVSHRGYHGANLFFKKIGQCIIHGLTQEGPKPTWVGTAFRYPRKLVFLREYPEKTQLVIAKLFRALVYDEIHPSQAKKFVDGVTAPYSGTQHGLDRLSTLIRRGMSTISGLSKVTRISVNDYGSLANTFSKVESVSWDKTGEFTPIYQEPPLKYFIESLDGTVFRDLEGMNFCFLPLSVRKYWTSEDRKIPEVVGEIHAAQEGGGKLRVFAAPNSAYQAVLTPLHKGVDRIRRLLSTDCTYDQSLGASWAFDRLNAGLTVASVDLSTATCRFPFSCQLQMLTDLGFPQDHIDAFKVISRGKWRVGSELVDSGYFPDFLRWEVGQPLGIRPSMSVFSLAHNMVLSGLCYERGLSPRNSFRVLGDDVVMVPDLYQDYVDLMAECGVAISWDKTYVSDRYAEFAGYCITRNTMVRPGRWRKATRQNVLALAEWSESPLLDEFHPDMVAIQEMWLYWKGSYTPEPHRLQHFISSVEIWRTKVTDPDRVKYYQRVQPWFTGFTACAERQLDNPTFFPTYQDPADLVKPFLDLPSVQMWSDMLDMWDWATTSDFIYQIWDSLLDAFSKDLLPVEEFVKRLQCLNERARAYFWLPPLDNKSKRDVTSKSYLRLLLNTAVEAGIVV